MKKTLAWILAAVMVLSMLTACGGSAQDDQPPQGGDDQNVTKIKVGIGTDAMPNCYLDKDGNLAGENYEVMCLVDEMLPQYEFVYETGTQEAILIGLDTGTYQVGINNFFYNDDRATKYIFPEYPVAAGVRGLILRNEYKDKITQGTTEEMLSQVAKLGLRNVPYSSDESGYTLYSNFNATHEEQLIFEVSEHAPIAVEVQDVINGRYDMISDLRSSYTAVKDEVDPNDETFFMEFTDAGFGTWVLYGKDQQELVDAIDGARLPSAAGRSAPLSAGSGSAGGSVPFRAGRDPAAQQSPQPRGPCMEPTGTGEHCGHLPASSGLHHLG